MTYLSERLNYPPNKGKKIRMGSTVFQNFLRVEKRAEQSSNSNCSARKSSSPYQSKSFIIRKTKR